MRKIISSLIALLVSHFLLANDVIVLKGSVRIDGKIESISNTELRYKKANNLTGPTYITPLADVSLIILENGEVLSYTDVKTEPTNNSTTLAKKDKIAVAKSPQTTVQNKTKRNLTPSDKTLMGVSVGYGLKQMPNDYPSCIISTCQLGYIVQPEFKYGLGIKTGANLEIGSGDGYYLHSILDVNISIPLQASYRCEWFKGFSTLIYTGPIFDFGILHKIKMDAQPYSLATNLCNRYGYEGFNCLWSFGLAMQYKGWRFAFDTGIGMVYKYFSAPSGYLPYEYYDYEDYGHGLMHKPMTLSIAYMFNCKKDN